MRSLLFILLLTGVPTVSFAAFSDVAEQSPYRNAIEFLKQENVIEGYTDGTFRPEAPVNRAEFLKMIMESRTENTEIEEVTEYKNCFSDVKEEWFAPYICEAHNRGWVQGYTDGSFKPAQIVNKVEALKMLLEVRGYQEELTVVDTKHLFDDVRAGEWFAPYVSFAKRIGILEETSSLFRPGNDMQRGGIAEIIFREVILREQNAEMYTPTLAQEVFAKLGYIYIDQNGSPILPTETGSGSTIINEEEDIPMLQETEEKSSDEEETPLPTNTIKKVSYQGTPPSDRIQLKRGLSFLFQQPTTESSSEKTVVLSSHPNEPLTWDLLSDALASLRFDIETVAQIVELLEYQQRIGDLGRYAQIEILGGTLDEAGGITIDVRAQDACYGSITSQYFFKNEIGLVEVRILSQEPQQQECV